MVVKLARVAFLLLMAVMVVSWAFSTGKSSAPDPQDEQPIGRMYS